MILFFSNSLMAGSCLVLVFENDLVAYDCVNVFWVLFLPYEFFCLVTFYQRRHDEAPYFQGQNKHNHSYNIPIDNRLGDSAYPSLRHRDLPYRSHANVIARYSNHQQYNRTWLKSQKSVDQKQSHQMLPSHFARAQR